MLRCSECKAPVERLGDLVVRTCAHTGAVVAEMEATAYGRGAADVGAPAPRRADTLTSRQ